MEVREPLVWPVGKGLEDEKLLRLTVITVIETDAQHTCPVRMCLLEEVLRGISDDLDLHCKVSVFS